MKRKREIERERRGGKKKRESGYRERNEGKRRVAKNEGGEKSEKSRKRGRERL